MYRKRKKGKYKHIPNLNLPKAELGMQIDPGMLGENTRDQNIEASNRQQALKDLSAGEKAKGFGAGFLNTIVSPITGGNNVIEMEDNPVFDYTSGIGKVATGAVMTGLTGGTMGKQQISSGISDTMKGASLTAAKKGNTKASKSLDSASVTFDKVGNMLGTFDKNPLSMIGQNNQELPVMKYGGKLKPVAGADEAMEYEGPSHEEGGIPVDGAGIPTNNPMEQEIEVEGGEVLADGEVWSDELIPGEKITFAQKAKQIDKIKDEKTKDLMLAELSAKAERVRQEKGIEENEVMMAKYGKKLKKANDGIKTEKLDTYYDTNMRGTFDSLKNNVALEDLSNPNVDMSKRVLVNNPEDTPRDPKEGFLSDMTTGDKAQLAGLFAAPAVNFGMARGIGRDVVEQQRKTFTPGERRISTKEQEREARRKRATITAASSQMANPGTANALRSAGLSAVTKAVQEAQFKGDQINTELAMKHDANLERMEEFNIARDLRNQEDARARRDLKRTTIATGTEQIGTGLERFGMQKNKALENKIKFAALNSTFENFKVTPTYDELIKQGKTDEEIKEIYQYYKNK